MRRRDILTGAAGVAGAAILGGAARGQSFPNQPIRLIVGFAAGGPTDVVARISARALSESLGQSIVVENRVGAGGQVGATAVARAEPDGYTLLANVFSDLVNPVIFPSTREPLLKNFAPIALTGTAPNVLVAHPSLGVDNVKQLVALARSKPESVTYGSAGIGTVGHLAGVLLSVIADIKLIHVPYNGSASAQTDLLSGRIGMMFDNLENGLNNARAGKLKALAVTGPERWPNAPEVPTMKEAGVPDFEVVSIFGLLAPVRTPDAVIQKIGSSLKTAMNAPETRDHMLRMGIAPAGMEAADYAAYLAAETKRWSDLVQRAGIKFEQPGK